MKFSDNKDNVLTLSPILLWNTHSYLFAMLSSKTSISEIPCNIFDNDQNLNPWTPIGYLESGTVILYQWILSNFNSL
jgi:hypothetical protein